eukprot:Skav222687  [mRNA]  locus=scaffold1471:107854:115006:- [translate_table: standard]
MSGGAYALLGMQLGDVLLNWERKSAPYRQSVDFGCQHIAHLVNAKKAAVGLACAMASVLVGAWVGIAVLPPFSRHRLPRSEGRCASFHGSSCCYLPDLLPQRYFQKVLAQFRQLRGHLSEEGPCMATGRLAVACTSGAAWRIFRSSWFRKRLQRVAGLPALPGKLGKENKETISNLPQDLTSLEFREYSEGSRMLWHADQVLLDPPQLEFVYTIENSSDSLTRWAPSHLHVLRDEIDEVWTAPNSGLLLQANVVLRVAKVLLFGVANDRRASELPGASPLDEAKTEKENTSAATATASPVTSPVIGPVVQDLPSAAAQLGLVSPPEGIETPATGDAGDDDDMVETGVVGWESFGEPPPGMPEEHASVGGVQQYQADDARAAIQKKEQDAAFA